MRSSFRFTGLVILALLPWTMSATAPIPGGNGWSVGSSWDSIWGAFADEGCYVLADINNNHATKVKVEVSAGEFVPDPDPADLDPGEGWGHCDSGITIWAKVAGTGTSEGSLTIGSCTAPN